MLLSKLHTLETYYMSTVRVTSHSYNTIMMPELKNQELNHKLHIQQSSNDQNLVHTPQKQIYTNISFLHHYTKMNDSTVY